MRYQAIDKDLIARYLTDTNGREFISEDFDISCHVWLVIRSAYLESAEKWQRAINQCYASDCMVNRISNPNVKEI